ncbi:MAG: hypothetical protein LM601_06145 [Candidatus Verstraetearchaeota archaeon]|nr:hypothetical protein [Candidatus Verstraetearchaeota archaeon]
MKKYINRKYITIFSIIILAIILLGNYFTCPCYLTPIGLDLFNRSLSWFEDITFNSTVIHYSGFLGEADFGLIVYFYGAFHPKNSREITKVIVVVEKISERTYNPLVKGFIINIEDVTLFDHYNGTDMHVYAYTRFYSKRSSYNLSESFHHFYPMYYHLPKTLYARIDYTVHVIINPYTEIWRSGYEYIAVGFHMKIYSGSVIIPINL